MRESLKIAKKLFGRKPVTVLEIGVMAGVNSKEIFDNLRISNLLLVDSWKNRYKADIKDRMIDTANIFEDNSNVYLIRGTALKVPFLQFFKYDYIYIDDCHSPDHVFMEMVHFWPMVKVGGVLAGHDWDEKLNRVSKAVKDFCKKYNLKFQCRINDGETVGDWWIIKEGTNVL